MASIKLIATDLDGTLIGRANELPLDDHFREVIDEVRREEGAVWAACTGRTMDSFLKFFGPMKTMGIMPDYVVANHAYIFQRTRFGYLPHVFWCLQIHRHIRQNARRARRMLDEVGRSLRGISHGVRMALREPGRLRLRFDSEESAKAALEHVKQRLDSMPDLEAERELSEIEIHTLPYTKGLAVSELARHLRLRRDQTLTIGNGENDLSMLTGSVAAYVGCPANSDPVVIEAVHAAGGHISDKSTLAGVLDILQAVRTGEIRSGLPAHWGTMRQSRGSFERRPRARSRKRQRTRTTVLLVTAVAVITILVFASFGLLPLSGLIMKPVNIFLRLVEKVLLWIFSVPA